MMNGKNRLEIVRIPTQFTMYQSVNAASGARRVEIDAQTHDKQVLLHIRTNAGAGVLLTMKQWRQMNREIEKMFDTVDAQHSRMLMNRAEV